MVEPGLGVAEDFSAPSESVCVGGCVEAGFPVFDKVCGPADELVWVSDVLDLPSADESGLFELVFSPADETEFFELGGGLPDPPPWELVLDVFALAGGALEVSGEGWFDD